MTKVFAGAGQFFLLQWNPGGRRGSTLGGSLKPVFKWKSESSGFAKISDISQAVFLGTF